MGEGGEDVKGPNEGNPNSKDHDNLQLLNEKVSSRKGKSCKGCLYYSSTLKSNSRNPVCVGITRSLPKAPRYYVGESEMEASKEGRSLADFRYGCVGYSVLVDRKVNNANSTPHHVHNKDNHAIPQPRVNRPAQSAADDFFSRQIYEKCKCSCIRGSEERA
ncbi:hypothetical protein Ccrd_012832 [Cynara cardunculus var. scolymus]|uniref:DUF8204 domain-containing protein n=1 Tax=Cynara cardunculus var. scolymus TaxID=59895 RepID=A0A103YGQ0_CYNCS|nr:hypothetical protein Ccrd_012832 [Cynara cardunculus var. scolymus]